MLPRLPWEGARLHADHALPLLFTRATSSAGGFCPSARADNWTPGGPQATAHHTSSSLVS